MSGDKPIIHPITKIWWRRGGIRLSEAEKYIIDVYIRSMTVIISVKITTPEVKSNI